MKTVVRISAGLAIETVNDGLGQLRAGKVTGRIVHVHRDRT
jgi:hypothetical protein